MPTITDPARDLADLCIALRGVNPNIQGFQAIAELFGVAPWSADFYELVFAISKRMNGLQSVISNISELDSDLKSQAVDHLEVIKQAFSQGGLNSTWSHSIQHYISLEHVNPIKMLSPSVRAVQPYPKLNAEEQAELLSVVDELLIWLRDFQIKEQDFIRQVIIDGLEQFRFRVERVSWIGWGYTLESLREVIGAYLALERGLDPHAAPDGGAVLKKVEAGLKFVFDKVGLAKDTTEKVQWLIEGYKNISALAIAGKGVVLLLGAN